MELIIKSRRSDMNKEFEKAFKEMLNKVLPLDSNEKNDIVVVQGSKPNREEYIAEAYITFGQRLYDAARLGK